MVLLILIIIAENSGEYKMNIIGKKIYLRAMEPEDMEMYREMANDPDTEKMVEGWSFPISKLEQRNWYEHVISDKSNLRFTIVLKESEEPAGMVNLVDIDWKNRSAFHGIKLSATGPKGKGIGTDAVMTIMQYAFEELQLNRLDGGWIEYNQPSLKLYKKCGWSVEGCKKRGVFKRGQFYDIYFGGILVEDYYEAKKRLNW